MRLSDTPVDTSVNPPKIQESANSESGPNPKHSVFALVDLSPNPFFGNEEKLAGLRGKLSEGLIRVDNLDRHNINKLLGLRYNEKDKINGTILWANTYSEHKEGGNHSYLFEDCAVFTVDSLDRMYGNVYSNAAITKIDDSFYTFLTRQDFEDLDLPENDGHDVKYAEATFRTMRGRWGNQRTGDKVVMPQLYLVKRPK